MNRAIATAVLAACAAAATVPPALAHSPVCSCFDNGDGTVTCEGGFSDGASAAGIPIRVVELSGRVLLDGKMDDAGTFHFAKPDAEYQVVFDAGEGHTVTIYGGDITE